MKKRQALLTYTDAPPDVSGLRKDVYLADEVDREVREMARLLRFVLAKGDKPMWLSDGWREDAEAVLTTVSASAEQT